MALSPRRTVAIGLASTMCGIGAQLLGAAVAVWFQSSAVFDLSFNSMSDRLPEVMERGQSAQQIMTIAAFIGIPLVVIGVITMTVGAIRWLWNEPEAQSGATP